MASRSRKNKDDHPRPPPQQQEQQQQLDIHELFCHYNTLYFNDSLCACAVSWSSSSSSSSPPRCAGYCEYYTGGGCEILLSRPILMHRPPADLKNTLLHEMIHAFLWMENKNKDHSYHGPHFQTIMDSINSNLDIDPQRPTGGYNITLSHELHIITDGRGTNKWICELCGDQVMSTMKGGPSPNDCIENVGTNGFCHNLSCHWHSHKKLCSGRYTKLNEVHGCNEDKKSSIGEQKINEERLNAKKNTIGKYFQSLGDAAAGSSGDNPSPREDSKKVNLEESEKIKLKTESVSLAPEVPKRARNSSSRKNHHWTSLKRRKLGKRNKEYTVISEWLNLYTDEEDDEDLEPLLNKRTEHRKEKLLNSSNNGITCIESRSEASTSYTCRRNGKEMYGDNNLLNHQDGKSQAASTSKPKTEVHDSPLAVDIEHLTAKTEACCEGLSDVAQLNVPDAQAVVVSNGDGEIQEGSCRDISPSNSPARGNIVDISD